MKVEAHITLRVEMTIPVVQCDIATIVDKLRYVAGQYDHSFSAYGLQKGIHLIHW